MVVRSEAYTSRKQTSAPTNTVTLVSACSIAVSSCPTGRLMKRVARVWTSSPSARRLPKDSPARLSSVPAASNSATRSRKSCISPIKWRAVFFCSRILGAPSQTLWNGRDTSCSASPTQQRRLPVVTGRRRGLRLLSRRSCPKASGCGADESNAASRPTFHNIISQNFAHCKPFSVPYHGCCQAI